MEVIRAHGSIHGKRGASHHPRGQHHLRSSATVHGVLAAPQGDVASPNDQQTVGNSALQPADASASLRYKRTERMGLVIQTQDGDTVRLRFKTHERLRAQITGGTDGDNSPEISLAARSNSKISMSVKGDLSADELTAIHDAFNQATALADEFFSGGLSAAFAGAESLNIDADQLARVTFKASVKQHLTYTSKGYAPALPPEAPVGDEAPVGEGPEAPGSEVPGSEIPVDGAPTGPAPVEGGPDTDAPAGPGGTDESPVTTLSDASASAPFEPSPPEDGSFPDGSVPPAGESEASEPAFQNPIQIIGEFLSRLTESLGTGPEGTGSGSLDVSLKIRIFQSALITLSEIQPSEEPGLPELVPDTLDKVAELQQPPVDAVA